jgi:hypothetical protein
MRPTRADHFNYFYGVILNVMPVIKPFKPTYTRLHKRRINVLVKAIILALPLFLAPHICLAQQFVRNGLPCVAEICLGDGLAELSKVQWDRVKVDKVSEGYMKLLRDQFRGDLVQAAPFLRHNFFDSAALSPLSRVTADCGGSASDLTGTYTTQSGNPTTVRIALIPRSKTDTSKHQWTVISISRSYPAAVSNKQKEQIEAQLAERYRAFDHFKLKAPKHGEGRYIHGVGNSLVLHRDVDRKLPPACGGSSKVNID